MNKSRSMKLILTIDVPDLKKGVSFYQKAFGWRVKRKLGNWGAELKNAPVDVCLLQNPAGTFAARGVMPDKRRYTRHWTPIHMDLVVPHIKAALRKAVKAGARQEGEIVQEPYGLIAYLSDPFGHGFCLIQIQGKGYNIYRKENR